MDIYWHSLILGLALGLGSSSGIRAQFDPATSAWMRVTICCWFASYIFILAGPAVFSRQIIPYYCLHAVVLIYRCIMLYMFCDRLADGWQTSRWRHAVVPIAVYMTCQVGSIAASASDISEDCIYCAQGGACPCDGACKALRICAEVTFVALILTLHWMFAFHLLRLVMRTHGKEVLRYIKNAYHLVLQAGLLTAVAFDVHRVVHMGGASNSPMSVLWQVVDVIVLLLFTEFGCKYHMVVRACYPDTAEEELETVRVQLTRSENTKTNILKYLHHELRNNLQKMTYLAERVSAEPADQSPEGARGVLDSIRACSAYISGVVDDVLTMENLDNNRLTLRPRRYDLHNLITGDFQHFQDFATANGRRATVHCDVPCQVFVIGDSDRISQVVRIMGESCISRCTASTIDDSDAHVVANAEMAHGALIVSIAAAVDNIFDVTLIEPYRLQPGDAPHDLSHSVVHRILTALHGHIMLDASRKRARILIPITLDEDAPAHRQSSAGSVRKLRMLIVDDSVLNRAILKKLLKILQRDYGSFNIEEAEDGEMATQMVLQSGEVFDIVWMDFVMPIKNGIDACHDIKAVLPTTTVIMVSANELGNFSDLGSPLSPDDTMVKPVTKAKLGGMLDKWVRKVAAT